jgi:hypothetical protein
MISEGRKGTRWNEFKFAAVISQKNRFVGPTHEPEGQQAIPGGVMFVKLTPRPK